MYGEATNPSRRARTERAAPNRRNITRLSLMLLCRKSSAGGGGILTVMTTIRACAAIFAAVVLVGAQTAVFAHEVTHNGTVVALKTAKYAQPSGGSREVRELEVAVVDPKTKKVANRVFTITDKTKITRAGKPIANAEVTAQKDERVAVVVDHDKPGDEAIHVRFQAAK